MNTPELLIAALLLDAWLGEPPWLWSRVPHPAVLMGRFIGRLDKTYNHGPYRSLKGTLCTFVLVTFAAVLGYLLSLGGPIIVVVVAAILLAQKALVQHVQAVSYGLKQSLQQGKASVAMIVSRDTRDMTEDQVARAALESAAENLSDGVIAPAFWFLVAGLPGLLVYKIVNTADSMIGYRNERYAEFGWSAARLDDVLNLIPARLTAALIAIVGLKPDLRGIAADARLHRSPNAGWPEAAMSRVLGVALAGPRAYDGTLQDFAWVNANGRKDLTAVDIDRSINILWKTWGLAIALLVVTSILV